MSSTQLGVSSGVPACGKGLDKQHSRTLSRTTSALSCFPYLPQEPGPVPNAWHCPASPPRLSPEATGTASTAFSGTESPERVLLAAFLHSSTANHKGSCPKPQRRITIAQALAGAALPRRGGRHTASPRTQAKAACWNTPRCYPSQTGPVFHITQ